MGDAVHAAMGRLNIGEILSDQGRLDEAEGLFRDALRVWRAAGFREGEAYAVGNLGRLASRGGRHAEAMELLERARSLFKDIGEERMVVEMDARSAESLLFSGEAGAALGLATDALRRSEKMGGMATLSALLHRIRGYAVLQQGELEEARAAFEESLRVAREGSADYEVGLTLEALERLESVVGDELARGSHADERRDVFERLSVVGTPEVPLHAAPRRPSATS
jgi:tetratricopeptide (TPR) repeat protein